MLEIQLLPTEQLQQSAYNKISFMVKNVSCNLIQSSFLFQIYSITEQSVSNVTNSPFYDQIVITQLKEHLRSENKFALNFVSLVFGSKRFQIEEKQSLQFDFNVFIPVLQSMKSRLRLGFILNSPEILKTGDSERSVETSTPASAFLQHAKSQSVIQPVEVNLRIFAFNNIKLPKVTENEIYTKENGFQETSFGFVPKKLQLDGIGILELEQGFTLTPGKLAKLTLTKQGTEDSFTFQPINCGLEKMNCKALISQNSGFDPKQHQLHNNFNIFKVSQPQCVNQLTPLIQQKQRVVVKLLTTLENKKSISLNEKISQLLNSTQQDDNQSNVLFEQILPYYEQITTMIGVSKYFNDQFCYLVIQYNQLQISQRITIYEQ